MANSSPHISNPSLPLNQLLLNRNDGLNSYGQILRSSSIIGGAQGINYLLGMVRTKLIAILLGPSGIGLLALYTAATALVTSVASLGIGSSGVREVAEASGIGDTARVGHTVRVLRRACWVTGFLGWALTAALAWPLSLWAFGSAERTWELALLGVTLLCGAITSCQIALIQGMRRIGDLARLNVLSGVVSSLFAIGLYAWLGERGIVPALISTAAINLGFSWWFAQKLVVPQLQISWKDTWQQSRRLIGLGAAFMWSGVLTAIVDLTTRTLVARESGLDATGIYQAVWAISGMFAGFILSAMGADFYPRLASVANDHAKINRLVNEQTEIGILLALPGLVSTLIFARWLMPIFYTAKFLGGAELLPWFVLGIFGRVVSWPMAYIQLAKGASRCFATTEAVGAALCLSLTVLLVRWLGLWGVALAFAINYGIYTIGMLWVGHRLTRFCWSREVLKLITIAGSLIVAGFATLRWVPEVASFSIGTVLAVVTCIVSIRGIAQRLGSHHRLVRIVFCVPGLRLACGL